MPTIRLGPVSITRVVEIGRSTYPTAQMLPDASADAIAPLPHASVSASTPRSNVRIAMRPPPCRATKSMFAPAGSKRG